MKFPWTFVALATATALHATTTTTSLIPSCVETTSINWISNSDEVIKERLEKINLPFETKFNSQTSDLIKNYLTSGYKNSQYMIGRSVLYFPIFEHYLAQHRLPTELKYLPIVESTLKPQAVSPVGAVGLWQFIPSTGRHYGLKIDEYVDERHDVYKSTEAAVKMLNDLYKRFGDWSLVLAAYNCGPSRVSRAIKATGKNNFWGIRSLLPKETQNYVPAFMAAAYIANYYNAHGMAPIFPKAINYNETVTFKVSHYVRFKDISFVSGLDIEMIKRLNPCYVKGIIPRNAAGNFVMLPTEAAPAFRKLMAEKTGNPMLYDIIALPGTFKHTYKVKPGDQLGSLATRFNCDSNDIMKWNGLTNEEVHVNQELVLLISNDSRVRP